MRAVPEGRVLRPVGMSPGGEEARRRLDRRNLLIGTAAALLLHLAAAGVIWTVDRFGVRDAGEWSGPVLVKIGVPEAPRQAAAERQVHRREAESMNRIESPGAESPAGESPAEAMNRIRNPAAESPGAESLPGMNGNTGAAGSAPGAADPGTAAGPESAGPAGAAVSPAVVRGSEKGNNYVMDFEGTESEVGRAGAYEYITSYMPLPESFNAEMADRAEGYLGMSPDFIRGEIERYWEPFRGRYIKKPYPNGAVPMADRPYYWSLLINSLGYSPEGADWKSRGMRPVVVEFAVSPSRGARGAELTDFKVVSRSDNPQVDDAVVYGLSRWVYYNDTERRIRGRITYNFEP